jgi:3-oxoacyl-[acyl-carrier protein] reductase
MTTEQHEGEMQARVAIVTGSTRGIGLATAHAMAAAGMGVVITGRGRADVDQAVAQVKAAAPSAPEPLGVVCDIQEPLACQGLVADTVAHFGRLDILVNNAGLGRFAKIQDMDPADWEVQIRTNLDGVFHTSQAAIPHLIRQGGGWIFNIASLAGRNAFSGGVAYNATKFGLRGMTEAMMLDLREHNIRVTCIMPGSVNTHFFGGEPGPEGDWKLAPEDIAKVIMDLLAFPDRALPSKIEIRPTRPPR